MDDLYNPADDLRTEQESEIYELMRGTDARAIQMLMGHEALSSGDPHARSALLPWDALVTRGVMDLQPDPNEIKSLINYHFRGD